MKAVQKVLANRRLRRMSAWQLLAADNAPAILGLLEAHLLGKERRLPASILRERIHRDLEFLRAEGVQLPQSAETYLAQWLREGYLERSFDAGASEEEYELSTPAIRAIQFIQGLIERRAAATESRLSLVIDQLQQLTRQTETNPELRIEALERERERLDAQIEAIRAGHVETLSDDRAIERAREIVALADELANDFRRVRDDFQQLNRGLREQIVDSEDSRGDVLEKLFAGVDVIAESEAGRTFKAFWNLLNDAERTLAFESALEQLLARDFSHKLGREERRFLLQLTGLLLERGGEVHDVFQHFARSLKQFVQSREYREQRRLNRLLKQAQREALALKDQVQATADTGHVLYQTSAKIQSLSQWRLYDPGQDKLKPGILLAGEAEISLEAIGDLLTYSEIDMRKLEQQVDELLARNAQVSVAQVLEAYPAEQGLGSVVGLLALGMRRGILSQEQQERVSWPGLDGIRRTARIPRIYFLRVPVDGDRRSTA